MLAEEPVVSPTFLLEIRERLLTLASRRSSRRSYLLGSAPAVAGGLAALGMAGPAFAEEAQNATNPASDKLWSNEDWAHKGDVKLYMFRKRAGAPAPGRSTLPVLFLVHGSSTSGTANSSFCREQRTRYAWAARNSGTSCGPSWKCRRGWPTEKSASNCFVKLGHL